MTKLLGYSKLYLCQGARVMLTSNLHAMFCLLNDSSGTVTDNAYLDGRSPKDSMVVVEL